MRYLKSKKQIVPYTGGHFLSYVVNISVSGNVLSSFEYLYWGKKRPCQFCLIYQMEHPSSIILDQGAKEFGKINIFNETEASKEKDL